MPANIYLIPPPAARRHPTIGTFAENREDFFLTCTQNLQELQNLVSAKSL
jgi:hypothetical protein